MDKAAKQELARLLKSLDKKQLWRMEAQEFVRQCYARIWISMCVDRRIEPSSAVSRSTASHKRLLPEFANAAAAIGIHTRDNILGWHGSPVALLASQLWSEAMAARQTAKPTPLEGISESNTPGWARSFGHEA
jgi:hypothetical protein